MTDIIYVLTLLTYTAFGAHEITGSNEIAYTLSNTDCVMEINNQRRLGNRERHNQQFYCMRVSDPVMRRTLLAQRGNIIYNNSAVQNGDVIIHGDVIIQNNY